MAWEERKTLEGLSYYYDPSTENITWEKPPELQTSEERELSKGDWVWIPHKQKLWQPAKRIKSSGSRVDLVDERNRRITIENGEMDGVKVPFWSLNRTALLFQEDDLVMLDSINEATIMHNLRTRYEIDELYTWVGAARSVLVSVNPYKRTDLYSPAQIDRYRNRPPNTKLAPHVFDIANDSFNSMLFDGKNQSILISGESGAGKTFATKNCLSFLANVAGSERNVEERVVLANPILEAYGNAQTIRNNNSSRFGKWIAVHFDQTQGVITSAEITNYLLEKSRVVYQQPKSKERNYHIFYQLTKTSEAKKAFSLHGPEKYKYTSMSGCYDAKDIDDKEGYDEVVYAMKSLGFSEEEKTFLFSVAAGVLKLGNCEFEKKQEANNVQGSKMKSSKYAEAAAKLFGVQSNDLIKVLSYRSIIVRGQRSVIPLDPEKARASCDSLAMGIYGKLFTWLVERVNVALRGDSKDSQGGLIGILDIFGFEIFEQNSFEQLMINFANEKLQQQFNKTTFKEEEALYQSEEIKFEHVDFIDNQVVLDLVEKPGKGILPMLDDECLVPEGTDGKFMNKIETTYKSHSKFETDTHRKLDNGFNFEIIHYAGVVQYNAEGFLVKNRDSMFADQQTLCNESSNVLMQSLFDTSKTVQTRGAKGSKSLSRQFRGQLGELMGSLYATESRYIRCCKPNGDQRPDQFQAPLVNDQLRYSGVYEAVEIRQQGFPFRMSYAKFACRYSCINMEQQKKKKMVVKYKHSYKRSPKKVSKEILSRTKYSSQLNNVVFGKTMLLYKTQEHRLLTLLREFAMNDLIPIGQMAMRGYLAREFRRRCKKVDKILAKALQGGKQSEIKEIEAALEKVDDILGNFANLFPGGQPINLAATLRHRDALKEWKKLEKSFAKLNKIVNVSEGDSAKMEEKIALANKIKDIPRTKKQEKMYIEAKEQHKYMQVKMELQKLENNNAKYGNLASFSNFKDPIEFSKGLLFGKAGAQAKMLIWQKGKLASSLTRPNASMDKASLKLLNKDAKKTLELIKQYSGQKKIPASTDENAIARELILTANKDAFFKDEVWCQLLKMTKENPDEVAVGKVWDLIALALKSVEASEDLMWFVLACVKNSGRAEATSMLSAYHNIKYGDGQYATDGSAQYISEVKGYPRNAFSVRHS